MSHCQNLEVLADTNLDSDSTAGHEFTKVMHEKFFLPESAGGLSVFKVEGMYYKVHRFMLERESPVFEAMFSSPSPSKGQDGESIEKPINIPDVSRSEFEALLDFLYNGASASFNELLIESTDTSIFTTLTAKQKAKSLTEMIENIWRKISDNRTPIFDLLSIALRFEFERIIKSTVALIDLLDKHCPDFNVEAKRAYEDLQAVKRINLALSHDALRHWLLPALQSLIGRPAPLTADEGRCLGYHRMAIVAAEREKRLKSYLNITTVPSEFLLAG